MTNLQQEDEIWKPIPGYDNYYASDEGRIKYFNEIVPQYFSSKKYLLISHEGKSKFAHVLIGLAWHDNPENKPFINHKNGVKWDNRPVNIEWSTHGVLVKTTRSVSHAAEFVGGAKTNVSKACKGQKPQYKGYTFEYATQPVTQPEKSLYDLYIERQGLRILWHVN